MMKAQRPSVIRWARAALSPDSLSLNPTITGPSCLKAEFTNLREKACQREDIKLDVLSGKSFGDGVVVHSKSFSFKKSLGRKERTFQCFFCDKSFKWRSHWQAHERTHTGERPFKCELCNKAFTRSDGLRCHRQTHIKKNFWFPYDSTKTDQLDAVQYFKHGGKIVQNVDGVHVFDLVTRDETKLFKCHICRRTFLSTSGLIKHLREHKDKKELKCEKCGMSFNRPSALEIHSRVHTGVKPYPCNVCMKSFSIYGNLKRHLLIHTGERPYRCSKCSSSFNNPSHLTRHLRSKHLVETKTSI